MPEFRIKRATLKDMDVLVRHRQNMFAEMGGKKGAGKAKSDPYREWARDRIREGLYHCYVVRAKGGKVAASGCVWLRQVQPTHGMPASMEPYLMSMYTEPEFRRKGLASMVVKEAMAWAKRKGYPSMTLHASRAGRKVYSKLGWERIWEMQVELD